MKSFMEYIIETKAENRIRLGSTLASSKKAAFLASRKEIQQGRRTRSKTWSGAGFKTPKQQRKDWNAGRDGN